MGLQTAEVNAAVDAAAARLVWMSVHTADPGGTGASEVSGGGYARQACTFGAASSLVAHLSTPVDFTGPANGDCKYVGFWSANAAGTWRGGAALTGDQKFNAAGEYTVTDVTVTGSAS